MGNKEAKIVFNVEAEISQIKQSAKDIEKSFSNLNLSQTAQKSLSNIFSNLTKNIQDFEVAAGKGFSSLSDVSKGQKSLDKINESFTKLKLIGKDLGNVDLKKLLPDNLVNKYKKLEEMLKKVNTLQSKDNSKAIQAATNQYNKQEKTVNTLRGKLEGLRKANESLGGSKSQISIKLKDAKKEANELLNEMKAIENSGEKGSKSSSTYKQLSDDYKRASKAVTDYENNLRKIDSTVASNKAQIKTLTEELKNEESTLSILDSKLKALSAQGIDTSVLTKLREDLASLQGVQLDSIPKDLDGIKLKLQEAANNSADLEKLKEALEKIGLNSEQAAQAVDLLNQKTKETGDSIGNMERMNSEMEQLKSRLTYFFSAMNGVQLFKRAIRSAYESVKELDAAITEMAVVTDYSINDIWGNMPQYTKTAVELGATTTDVIKSMVLYTQQGLNMAQATELSTETMKMARIAGLEGAEATDLMTAALRGFNMELNETSAQRVNDVYSNLAANAAANTQEIADAMTRTASIANAAGMEFETTAAFLTQMINFATCTRVA